MRDYHGRVATAVLRKSYGSANLIMLNADMDSTNWRASRYGELVVHMMNRAATTGRGVIDLASLRRFHPGRAISNAVGECVGFLVPALPAYAR